MKIIGALIGFIVMAVWFALRFTTFVAGAATGCLLLLALITSSQPAFGAAGLCFTVLVLIEMALLGGRGLGRRNGGGHFAGYARRRGGRFRPPGFF